MRCSAAVLSTCLAVHDTAQVTTPSEASGESAAGPNGSLHLRCENVAGYAASFLQHQPPLCLIETTRASLLPSSGAVQMQLPCSRTIAITNSCMLRRDRPVVGLSKIESRSKDSASGSTVALLCSALLCSALHLGAIGSSTTAMRPNSCQTSRSMQHPLRESSFLSRLSLATASESIVVCLPTAPSCRGLFLITALPLWMYCFIA